MNNQVIISKKIESFNKSLKIDGDKSLSIRWALLASQAKGKSKSYNLLKSEDVLNALNCLKKLGTKIKLKKNTCEIIGLGINKFIYKKKNCFKCWKFRNFGKINFRSFGALKDSY